MGYSGYIKFMPRFAVGYRHPAFLGFVEMVSQFLVFQKGTFNKARVITVPGGQCIRCSLHKGGSIQMLLDII